MAASVPFSIPRESPLARGWRAAVVFALERHGVHQVMDAIAAYAELRCRHEPDNCSPAEEAAQGGWYRYQAAALRRIEAIEIPENKRGRPKLEK